MKGNPFSSSCALLKCYRVSETNSAEKEKEVRVDVADGGWGWVVVIASFVVNFIADGISYSYGLFNIHIKNEFHTSESAASWIGSILFGLTYCFGPVASFMVNRFDCRVTTITGAIIAALGLGVSYFAPNVYFLYVSIGIIGGFGMALTFLPSLVIIVDYFERRISLATGIAICGSGFGSSALPPLFNLLMTHYGWRLSLVFAAGMLLIIVPFALAYKPAKPRRSLHVIKAEVTSKEFSGPTPEDSGIEELRVIQPTVDAPEDRGDQSPMSQSKTFSPNAGRSSTKFSPESSTRTFDTTETPVKCCWLASNGSKACERPVFLTSPVFILLAISNFFTNFGYDVHYIYIPDLVQKKFKLMEGNVFLGCIVSTTGFMNAITQIIVGYLSDLACADRLYIYSGSVILCGIATILTPIVYSLIWVFTWSGVFGASGGASVALTSVVLLDFIGSQHFSDAFGYLLMFQGVGAIIGPPTVGAMIDFWDDHTYGFWISGAIVATSGAILLPLHSLHNCEERHAIRRTLGSSLVVD